MPKFTISQGGILPYSTVGTVPQYCSSKNWTITTSLQQPWLNTTTITTQMNITSIRCYLPSSLLLTISASPELNILVHPIPSHPSRHIKGVPSPIGIYRGVDLRWSLPPLFPLPTAPKPQKNVRPADARHSCVPCAVSNANHIPPQCGIARSGRLAELSGQRVATACPLQPAWWPPGALFLAPRGIETARELSSWLIIVRNHSHHQGHWAFGGSCSAPP